MSARSLLASPWPAVVLVLVALTLGVAFAPLAVVLSVAGVAAATVLIWKFGVLEGLWFLMLASIPLREPLSIDLVGTASLFPTDLLLFALLAAVIRKEGLRGTWRESTAFRIGLLIFALSLPGLVTASRLFWGVNAVYRIVGQVAMLVVARRMVRSGRDALRALVAVVVGLVPVVIYGLYQASLPYGADLPDWSVHYIAWDAVGQKNVRIFSTFRHPLHLAHYLAIGLGLSLGLLASTLKRGAKLFLLLVGTAGAICTLFTQSIGGLVGMSAAVATTLVLERRRRIVLLAPVLLVALLFIAPPAMTTKLVNVLTGQATTGAARLITYGQAMAVLRDKPLTGVGWGGMRSALESDYRVTRADAVAFAAENYFLQRAVALGLPGMMLVVILCVLFFRNSVRPRGELPDGDWPRAAVLTAGVALFAHAQFFPMAYPAGNQVLWLLIAIAERMREYSVASREGTV